MKTANIEVTYVNHCGTDLDVVNAARVSFHKESEWDGERNQYGMLIDPRLSVADQRLIRYLASHKHFSPFNHAFLSFRVKAPIFVARQLVKHKFLPWNEVSRRYIDEEPEFYFPEYWRKKADNVKQGSSEERVDLSFFTEEGLIDPDWKYTGLMDLNDRLYHSIKTSLGQYQGMLTAGVAPEQARMVLPQNTMTEWIWSGTLGAFCDMLRLRLDPHTQYESQLVAQKIHDEVIKLFPFSTRALLDGVLSTPEPLQLPK